MSVHQLCTSSACVLLALALLFLCICEYAFLGFSPPFCFVVLCLRQGFSLSCSLNQLAGLDNKPQGSLQFLLPKHWGNMLRPSHVPGCWVLNSDPHTFVASALQTEAYIQALSYRFLKQSLRLLMQPRLASKLLSVLPAHPSACWDYSVHHPAQPILVILSTSLGSTFTFENAFPSYKTETFPCMAPFPIDSFSL